MRPARWLQAGGFTIEPAPNAWGYSEYFPPIGEIVWAWTMLPVGNDSLLVFANLLICGTMGAGLYGAARLIGASESAAVLAAAALVMSPSIAHYVPSGYVDPLTVALFTLGVVFGGRALLERSGADAVLDGGGARARRGNQGIEPRVRRTRRGRRRDRRAPREAVPPELA